MTRKPESDAAKALAARGVEIVKGDLDDDASLKQALAGAWGAFSVQNTWEAGVEGEERKGKNFARLARAAGIQHFVYTSVASAHRGTAIPHFENKWRIEQTVRELGFPSYFILRPVFFMENLAGPWFLSGIQEGKLAIGMQPDTLLQMIAVKDIGKYGAWAFENHANLNGRELDIAGDQMTGPQAAEVLARVTRHPVEFVQVPIDQVRSASDDFATMLEWFDSVGYDADIAAHARERHSPHDVRRMGGGANLGAPVNAS
jgi:uncharacterized protein YbjT (DUF2867 family)